MDEETEQVIQKQAKEAEQAIQEQVEEAREKEEKYRLELLEAERKMEYWKEVADTGEETIKFLKEVDFWRQDVMDK